MRHLKLYEELKNNRKDDFMESIEDCFLELTDIGFKYSYYSEDEDDIFPDEDSIKYIWMNPDDIEDNNINNWSDILYDDNKKNGYIKSIFCCINYDESEDYYYENDIDYDENYDHNKDRIIVNTNVDNTTEINKLSIDIFSDKISKLEIEIEKSKKFQSKVVQFRELIPGVLLKLKNLGQTYYEIIIRNNCISFQFCVLTKEIFKEKPKPKIITRRKSSKSPLEIVKLVDSNLRKNIPKIDHSIVYNKEDRTIDIWMEPVKMAIDEGDADISNINTYMSIVNSIIKINFSDILKYRQRDDNYIIYDIIGWSI